jgi:hypothetical protein
VQERDTKAAELQITARDALTVAALLRYAVSLNTAVGLVSPTQRRLATSTYRAVELAAGILEGKPLEEAIRNADYAWTGSLEQDHLRAIELLELERDTLRESLSDRLTPDQLTDYLEVHQDQYLELLRRSPLEERDEPGG